MTIVVVVLSVTLAALLLFGATVLGLAWVVADRVVRPRRLPPTAIVDRTANTITIARTKLSSFPGPMGLLYDDETKHIAIGSVLESGQSQVVRSAHVPEKFAVPSAGRIVADPYGSPHVAGLEMEEVSLSGRAAWVLRGPASTSGRWAVQVHGAMSGRESMLRTAQTLADDGYTSIAVTYSGDEPEEARRASSLGSSEWHDLEPAVLYAKENGARSLLLVGISQGSTIALNFLAKSLHAHEVSGVIGVAPILDWTASIAANVRAARLPTVAASAAMWLMSSRGVSQTVGLERPLSFRELNFTEGPAPLVPVLLIHATGDPVAPYATSSLMARRHSETVTLATFANDAHALEWNEDPEKFARVIREWLTQHKMS